MTSEPDPMESDSTALTPTEATTIFEPVPDEENPGTEDAFAYGTPQAFSPMHYVGVEVILPSTNPVLILREEDEPHRELHIPIALADGVAIAFAARRVPTPKPLTHELISNMLEGYGLTLEQVRITGVDGTSYSAELILSGSLGSRVLDCRVTDGLCLALRQRLDVPVTAAKEVLFQASIPAKSS